MRPCATGIIRPLILFDDAMDSHGEKKYIRIFCIARLLYGGLCGGLGVYRREISDF
ncbi:MAG: hypothetical protein JXA44_05755 [Methanospirillaceae archaeon]|nr:hypothetical protein [Methanospirillaceae archaeon]